MNALSLFNDWLNNEDFGMNGLNKCGYGTVPEVDVTEKKDAYVLDMDLPGQTEKDINIELNDTVLTISSVKEAEKEEKSDSKKSKDAENDGVFLLKERRRSEFRRSFTLPKDIDAEKVMANFKNGVLTVQIPRKPESQPKRISINIA